MKQFTLLLFLSSFSIVAQYEYEPSKAFPYGKANPEAPQEIKDFQPLIGQCKCKSESRKQDGSWAEPVDMLWTFKYIMNGKAIQDETLKEDGSHSGSIRQFNADSSKWYVHYYSSSSLPKSWEGSKNKDNNIVLYREQKAPNGTNGYFRLTFYNIDQSGYDWIGEWTNKSETFSYPTWRIRCKKTTPSTIKD